MRIAIGEDWCRFVEEKETVKQDEGCMVAALPATAYFTTIFLPL